MISFARFTAVMMRIWERSYRNGVSSRMAAAPIYRDGCCSHIQMFFSKNLAGNVLADGREFTCYRVFQMRSHSRDEHHLYIGMKKLIQKAVDVGELRADISVEEVNGYLFTVFRGVLYEWCLCAPEDIFSLEERLDRMIGYALRAFSA